MNHNPLIQSFATRMAIEATKWCDRCHKKSFKDYGLTLFLYLIYKLIIDERSEEVGKRRTDKMEKEQFRSRIK